MRKNTDQKNSEYRHFSRSAICIPAQKNMESLASSELRFGSSGSLSEVMSLKTLTLSTVCLSDFLVSFSINYNVNKKNGFIVTLKKHIFVASKQRTSFGI